MLQKPVLETAEAKIILQAAEASALRRKLLVSIMVADESGAAIAALRVQGARAQTAELALRKARCAALTQRPTKFWADAIKDNPGFAFFPDMCAIEGGVPIFRGEFCVGAIGVSGAPAGMDDEVTADGIAALTLA